MKYHNAVSSCLPLRLAHCRSIVLLYIFVDVLLIHKSISDDKMSKNLKTQNSEKKKGKTEFGGGKN